MKQNNKKEDFSVCCLVLQQLVYQELLSGNRIVREGSGNKKGKGILRAGAGKDWDF